MTEPTEPQEPQEPQEPVEAPAEPDAEPEPDTEPDAEPQEPIEPPDDTEPPTEPTEPTGAFTEKELETIGRKLDLDKNAHRRKLETILGNDLGGYIPCPTCMDGVDGFIFPPEIAPLTEDQRNRMLEVLGLDEWNEMPSASWAQQCGTCLGYGKVKTGSHVGGRETAECEDCAGAGWNNTRRAASVAQLAPVEENGMTGPTVLGLADPDPRVDSLRRDGFTVIPPPTWTTGS